MVQLQDLLADDVEDGLEGEGGEVAVYHYTVLI